MQQLDILKSHIVTLEELDRIILRLRLKGQKIVFTNGCFDLLHQGHIDYLSKAADLGNVLIVGVNSDASVRRLGKGSTRPLQDETSRAMIMASLHFVSYVVIFDEDTPFELIDRIKPHVLVKGSDYQIKDVVGHDIVLKNGGEVRLIDYLEGFSTSNIERKIKAST